MAIISKYLILKVIIFKIKNIKYLVRAVIGFLGVTGTHGQRLVYTQLKRSLYQNNINK